jgi:glucokinase
VSVAVGIDVGGTKTAIGVVETTSGEVVEQRTIASDPSRGAEELYGRIVAALAEMSAPEGSPVGLAVPELVSPAGQVLTEVVIPGMTGDLLARWADMGLCAVESDVRAAAIAEARFGLGAGLSSFVYVSVGTGVSSCLVIDGRPWTGQHGAAILVGSGIVVDDAGRADLVAMPSLESVAGGPGIVEGFRRRGGVATTAEEVMALIGEVEIAQDAAVSSGRALGLGLAELVNLLDPPAVIVGGGLGSAPGPYWDAAVEAARARIWAEVARGVPLLQSEIGPRAGMIGVAFAAGAR